MKRYKPKKRRDRRASKARSPYHKYQKAPYQYSAAYREWQREAKAGRVQALEGIEQ